jgi:hypothetical protein
MTTEEQIRRAEGEEKGGETGSRRGEVEEARGAADLRRHQWRG